MLGRTPARTQNRQRAPLIGRYRGCRAGQDEPIGGVMRTSARWLLIGGAGAAALAVTASGIAPAVAGPGAAAKASLAASGIAVGPVSSKPATGTPSLTKTGSRNQVIRQLVQCGGTMYAVGSFSQITKSGTVF